MRVLFLFNYPTWNKVYDGLLPSNQLFGIKEATIRVERNEKNEVTRAILKNGYCDFLYLPNGEGKFKSFLKVLIRSYKYDVIYDGINCVGKTYGVFHKLFPSTKLVSVLHHPPFTKLVKYAKFDHIIFFTEQLLDLAKSDKPSILNISTYNEWQPDIAFYNKICPDTFETKYDFVDNGRTGRDYGILFKALEKVDCTVFCFNQKIKDCNINKIIFTNDSWPSWHETISILKQSRVILIPLKLNEGKILGPLGATSFMDAIALHKPVVCPSSASFAYLVKNRKLGVVYNDSESLAKGLSDLKYNEKFYEECVDNMADYERECSMKNYSDKVISILDNISK